MPAAFYVPDGDHLVPTELTRGPWRRDAQHAGPPLGLLGRALERCPAAQPMRVVRITTEILRPVPLDARLEVEAAVVRPGRNVQLLEATLAVAGGADLLRARAWRMRTADVGVPQATGPPPAEPPGQGAPRAFFPGAAEVGWHTGMEIRFVEGGFVETGPARAWLRLRQPLVDGEEPTPLQCVLVAADAGNGLSAALDFERYVFINTDVSVHLFRAPRDDWVHMDARTVLGGDGTGVSDTLLADRHGVLGRALQSLLVAPREG